MLYHITYRTRSGQVEVGRVSVPAESNAAIQRRRAIQAAGWKYPDAVRQSISAVRIGR